MKRGVLLVSHGTVDDLADLPAFLTNIRRGHAAPPELVAEVTRRYRAIGGSPLNAVNAEVAKALEAKLGVPTRLSNRLWRPYPKDVLRELLGEGVEHVAVVPLAQHSAGIYAEAAESAAKELAAEGAPRLALACAGNWGQSPRLLDAFARRITAALAGAPSDVTLIMTAHSLPKFIIDAGDPYEREVRASAEAIASLLPGVRWTLAFQSQGMSAGPGGRPVAWLGPDLTSALDEAKAAGSSRVVIAPIGFLADHVEILYDLGIEAKGWADARGLALSRTESLNASPDFIDVLAEVAAPLLASESRAP